MPSSPAPSTAVLQRGPAQFDMTGRCLGYPLKPLDECISAGLARRLLKYAVQRGSEAGFGPLLAVAAPEVYTLDVDDKPSDRSYCVKFKTSQGGYLELVGILTRNGWPSLDHGFEVGVES
jgi:hypothetical protein